ncbi:MAG: hypothetical protein WCB04_04930 [Mycobacteriales bacterium]
MSAGIAVMLGGPVAGLLTATCLGAVAAVVRWHRVEAAEWARCVCDLELLRGLGAELRGGRHPVAALRTVPSPTDA